MIAVVTGMIATYPIGGVAWDYGQYLLGLERLGFEVHYLEDVGYPIYDPIQRSLSDDPSYGVEFLRNTLAALSPPLAQRWHFRAADGRMFGSDSRFFDDLVAGADLLLNVSGGSLLRPAYLACPRKVLIDTDPGWNHFVRYPQWDANPVRDGARGYRAHDYFFTYAERLGQPDCPLPTFGLMWQPTRPPVVLDCWNSEPPGERWTTVMTWDNFRKPIENGAVSYGTKEREYGRIENLPSQVGATMEVAVGGNPPRDHWRKLGWSVIDSHSVSHNADDYRRYIQQSRGEFSVTKNVYAATRCGWFSCRTVCYLAAGRPAVVQDTGFSEFLPTGRGLFAFTDSTSAAASINAVESDYTSHQHAAREIAKQYFASDVVLKDMLDRIGL